ncbi:hypothetical protein AHAS_Ahas15G0226400 [Arachis hypogaea]
MSSKTVPIEEIEAVDLSKVNADIEVEESMMIVDEIGSFDAIELSALTAKDILKTEFINLQETYDYYNEYGRIKGFSVRRSKVGCRTKQGSEGESIWQIFVCSKEGELEGKHMQPEDRKMDPRPIIQYRCEARIKVHVDDTNGQWYVEQFFDNHNHAMLDVRFRGLIRSHRSVKEGDLHQINSMRKASCLKSTDCGIFWKYSLDGDKRLQNLFWCKDVDHYMKTVVFSYAILSNESEESYVWLLRSFLEAMKGKQPKSMMTDQNLAMKSTVSTIFPSAHHRLCSWHLLRNGTANVGRHGFLQNFHLCLMGGDLEVDEFERI